MTRAINIVTIIVALALIVAVYFTYRETNAPTPRIDDSAYTESPSPTVSPWNDPTCTDEKLAKGLCKN